MAIQSNVPDKRNSLQDLVAAALRGEKVVIAVEAQPRITLEPTAPKANDEQEEPEGSQS